MRLSVRVSIRALAGVAVPVLVALASSGCPKRTTSATGDAAASATASTTTTTSGYSDFGVGLPLPDASAAPPPEVLPLPGPDAGTRYTQVLYAHRSASNSSLVSVAPVEKRALVRTVRMNTEDAATLVVVDLDKGKIIDTFTPSPALHRVLLMVNAKGPALADELHVAPQFHTDVVGVASRIAKGGDPWVLDRVATSPGRKHIVFESGLFAYAASADGAGVTPIAFGASALLSPNGKYVAMIGCASAGCSDAGRFVIADLDAGSPAREVPGISNTAETAWAPDGATLYARGRVDSGDAGTQGAAESCIFAIDAAKVTATKITCAPGEMTLSPSAKTAVLVTSEMYGKKWTRYSWISMTNGAVKKEITIKGIVGTAALLDDAGLVVGQAGGHGRFIVVVDFAKGTTKLFDETKTHYVISEWIAPHAFVGARNVGDTFQIERFDVDALPPVTLDEDGSVKK